jgi:pimeloyl-ACP methyl ester carboxylesterase
MAVDKNSSGRRGDRGPLDDDAGLGPPSGNKFLRESLTVRQVPRLAFRTPALLFQAPRGTRQPVLLLPGLKAGDASNAPMRSFLRRKNFRVWGWGLGTNNGDVPGQLPKVVARVEELFERAGEPIALIGWSLGGVLARELARERPELVSQVITYGTPVIGGPLYTAVSGVYTPEERREIARRVAERNRISIDVPITALYSKRDGIVAWRACIDDFSPDVTMIEVRSTHVGMGIDPDVWQIVSERLVG